MNKYFPVIVISLILIAVSSFRVPHFNEMTLLLIRA